MSEVKRKTAHEIIDFVLEHIQKNGRAIDSKTGCCYYLTEDGKRCAHSICCNDEIIESEFLLCGFGAGSIINDFGDEVHKPEFRGREVEFWIGIQDLHDVDQFWKKDNSLSLIGQSEVERLKSIYND